MGKCIQRCWGDGAAGVVGGEGEKTEAPESGKEKKQNSSPSLISQDEDNQSSLRPQHTVYACLSMTGREVPLTEMVVIIPLCRGGMTRVPTSTYFKGLLPVSVPCLASHLSWYQPD